MKDGSRRGVRPREQRWEFWSFEPGAEMWRGQAEPLWRYAGLFPDYGGVLAPAR